MQGQRNTVTSELGVVKGEIGWDGHLLKLSDEGLSGSGLCSREGIPSANAASTARKEGRGRRAVRAVGTCSSSPGDKTIHHSFIHSFTKCYTQGPGAGTEDPAVNITQCLPRGSCLGGRQAIDKYRTRQVKLSAMEKDKTG